MDMSANVLFCSHSLECQVTLWYLDLAMSLLFTTDINVRNWLEMFERLAIYYAALYGANIIQKPHTICRNRNNHIMNGDSINGNQFKMLIYLAASREFLKKKEQMMGELNCTEKKIDTRWKIRKSVSYLKRVIQYTFMYACKFSWNDGNFCGDDDLICQIRTLFADMHCQ